MSMSLLLAASTVPATTAWSPKIGVVMIICNILAIAIGKATIKHPSEGPALPMSEMFGGMGLPALLATTSFGHVLGAGVILGLASMGAI